MTRPSPTQQQDEVPIKWDWFLIESWPGMMLTAKEEIVTRGVEYFLPMTWRRAKVDGKDQPHASARLPGNYAFVRLGRAYTSHAKDAEEMPEHLDDQAAGLAQLRGVRTVYKNASGRYATVPRYEIQDLRVIEAQEHKEAARGRGKITDARFLPGTKVRIVRHASAEGHAGEYLYTYHGMATLAMPGGIKFTIPECDLVEVTSHNAKMVG